MAKNKSFTDGFETAFSYREEKKENNPVAAPAPKSDAGIAVASELPVRETIPAAKKSIKKKKKETKSVHKNFLITPTLNDLLKELAAENEMTENEAINAILNEFFEIEG